MRDTDSHIEHNAVRTLRTNNSGLWVLPSDAYKGIFGEKGRLLSRKEKCRLAGVVPSSLRDLSDSDIEIVIRNTIPVPLAGVMLGPLFRAFIEMTRTDARQSGPT